MLLVAVTGEIGSGKSTLLSRIAELAPNAVGFISRAGARPNPNSGADTYDLVNVRTGESARWATRSAEGGDVPYVLNPDAVRSMYDSLSVERESWLILDEFGKLEARGKGLVEFWPQVRLARPTAVLISVRKECLPQVEEALGQKFDLVFDAAEVRAEDVIVRVSDGVDWISVGRLGLAAGMVETTVGTALHAWQFPLRGPFMAAVQASFLRRSVNVLLVPKRCLWISIISASTKALMPSTSKLRPIVAILMQGWLFTLCIRFIPHRYLAAFVGTFLVGAWSGAQAVLVALALNGNVLIEALKLFLPFNFTTDAAILIGFSGAVALIPMIQEHFMGSTPRENEMQTRLSKTNPARNPLIALLPLLIIPMLGFIQHASWQILMQNLFRVLGVLILLELLGRYLLPKLAPRLLDRLSWGPKLAFNHATPFAGSRGENR